MPIPADLTLDVNKALRAGKTHRALALVVNEALLEARRTTLTVGDPVDAFLEAMCIIEGYVRAARTPYEKSVNGDHRSPAEEHL